jgi:hypothetical protein
MPKLSHCLIALALAPLVAAESNSSTFLSSTIGSNMVLQRDVSASVYGWAKAANTTVICEIDGQQVKTTSSMNATMEGSFAWSCTLPKFSGSFTKYDINITAVETGQFAMMENVVFGDVFLCGGQSNMEFSMPGMFDGDTEIADADNYPYIRKFIINYLNMPFKLVFLLCSHLILTPPPPLSVCLRCFERGYGLQLSRFAHATR